MGKMEWTYYYRLDVDSQGTVVNTVRLRVNSADTWQTLEPDGIWRSGAAVDRILHSEVPGVTVPEVPETEMAHMLWAATDSGRFSQIPTEPRLDSYEPDWQYCVLRPIDVDTRTTQEMVFSESEDIDFSEIRFGRHNRNHYDLDNFQELRYDGSRWVETERLFILFAKGDGRLEPLYMPTEAVARLIDRAVAHGNPTRRPDEPAPASS